MNAPRTLRTRRSRTSGRTAPARRSHPGRSGALLGALLCLQAFSSALAAPVERILEGVRVSAAQPLAQMTPVAVHDGEVFLATIEPGPSGDGPRTNDLRIVVRRGVAEGDAANGDDWRWSSTVVERRGVYDRWHTPPAVGVDETGRVHVAYNMHNFPWQYAVTSAPLDIDTFEFRGQAITQAELDLHTFENRTSFPDLGTAAIPGNQITYPAFVNAPDGRLHVTYRFAAKPNRAFDERTFGSGLARLNAASGTWTSLGGPVAQEPGDYEGPPDPGLRALAARTGWTSYAARLGFAPDGGLVTSMLWRSGIAGSTTTDPCVFKSADGGSFTTLDGAPASVPVRPEDCPNVDTSVPGADHYSLGDMAVDGDGHALLLLSPTDRSREIHRWDGSRWSVERAPGGAVAIFHDDEWNLWALAQGLSLYLRRAGTDEWEAVVSTDGTRECLPKVAQEPAERSVAYAFSLGCDADEVAVTRFDLRALRGDDVAEPAVPDVTPSASDVATTIPPRTWRQVSLPFTADDLTPGAAFGDGLPASGYGSDWVLFGFDAAAGEYFEPAAGDALEPGRGYWLIHALDDEVTVRLPRGARPVPTIASGPCAGASCAPVPLASPSTEPGTVGWNLGGTPALASVDVADVRVVSDAGDCRDGCTLDDALDARVAGDRLFRYDDAANAYERLGPGDALAPWEGYWGIALPDAGPSGPTLLFPAASPALSSRSATGARAARAAPPEPEASSAPFAAGRGPRDPEPSDW